jgi:hypothetical protein
MAFGPHAAAGGAVTSEGRASGSDRPVLVLGLPRSGTTWTAHILGQAPGVVTVMEPDNEKTCVTALRPKRGLGRFPVLGPGDEAGAYRDLWAWALAGGPSSLGRRLGGRLFASVEAAGREEVVQGRPPARARLAGYLARPVSSSPARGRSRGAAAERAVVKSVHGVLATEWITESFPVDVVVVLRHPASVLASWLELDLPDRDRHLDTHPVVRRRYLAPWGISVPGSDPLERAVWQLGLLTAALEEAVANHPRWRVRTHEDLCVDPPAKFRALYEELGLLWTQDVAAAIEGGDQPGSGFDLQRQAQDAADGWRTRLEPSQRATVRRVLAPFPLRQWSTADFGDDTCAG